MEIILRNIHKVSGINVDMYKGDIWWTTFLSEVITFTTAHWVKNCICIFGALNYISNYSHMNRQWDIYLNLSFHAAG